MNTAKSLLIAFALTASHVSAADTVWPKHSASDLSTFVTLQRFRIYADHCSVRVSGLKPKFDELMAELTIRIEDLSKGLLASEAFRDMKDKPVPAEIIFALKDSLEDTEHNFERQDAASSCPGKLRSLGEMDRESLKSDLKENFAAIQNMIRSLEKDDARQ